MSGSTGELFLGGRVDPGTGERTGETLLQPAHHLTTHGVILGMTGSGKTGLGVVLLEEALLQGVPVLALDPKGDIGNLLLNFPDLAADDFRPWVDPAEARRRGTDVDRLAHDTAETWKKGLASWDIGPERMRELRARAEMAVYTPGSGAGLPLDLVGSLKAPDMDWDLHAETIRDEIEGFVSSLLTMADLGADPLSDPEHILLANVIEHAWREGRDLDLATLIGLVLEPPLRKLGVFPLDDFFPEKGRRALAMRLNALVASPTFGGWLEGAPVDYDRLLWTGDGRPRACIVYLAHLSDTERQFVVTLLLTRLITWMRRQPGTSDLKALVYMDEMFGFAPPTAEPPSKRAILTIFKQARAHGLGMVVSTQNPVDLDYKTMSNAGTWMVGRLQTERDKARVLEGLRSAAGSVDVDAFDALIGGLRKREFVFRTTRSPEPVVFTTRWAMAYLRGALTREELIRLRGEERPEAGEEGPATPAEGPGGVAKADSGDVPRTPAARPSAPADDESPVAPTVPEGVASYYLDPAASWSGEVGAVAVPDRFEAALVARVHLKFDDRYAEVDHEEEWEAVFFPLHEHFDPDAGLAVDYEDRDLRTRPPEGALYALSPAPLSSASWFRDAGRAIEDRLHRDLDVTVFRNRALGLYSRVGEDRKRFSVRCLRAALDGADADVASLRERYARRIDSVRDALRQAERRVRELEVDLESRQQQELVAGAGKVLSLFLGGRAGARSLSGVASRRATTRRARERLRTASERALDKEGEIRELEEELADEIRVIVGGWREKAGEIETVVIGLEKDDISVEEVALLWIPRAR